METLNLSHTTKKNNKAEIVLSGGVLIFKVNNSFYWSEEASKDIGLIRWLKVNLTQVASEKLFSCTAFQSDQKGDWRNKLYGKYLVKSEKGFKSKKLKLQEDYINKAKETLISLGFSIDQVYFHEWKIYITPLRKEGKHLSRIKTEEEFLRIFAKGSGDIRKRIEVDENFLKKLQNNPNKINWSNIGSKNPFHLKEQWKKETRDPREIKKEMIANLKDLGFSPQNLYIKGEDIYLFANRKDIPWHLPWEELISHLGRLGNADTSKGIKVNQKTLQILRLKKQRNNLNFEGFATKSIEVLKNIWKELNAV